MILLSSSKPNAAFPSDDRIFLGEGLFETLRIWKGRLCYPDLHWQRLRQSAALLQIGMDLSYADWCQQLQACLQKTGIQDGGLKVLLSGGSAPRGLLQTGEQPRLLFETFPGVSDVKPLSLVTAPWLRDSANPIYALKSVNYLEAIMARRYAQKAGADDALFFNTAEQVTETTVANVFIIRDQTIYTPPLSSGILAGILRSRLIEQAPAWGIVCKQQPISKESLVEADVVLTTNVLQGLRPVKSWESSIYNCQHPLIKVLQDYLAGDAKANVF